MTARDNTLWDLLTSIAVVLLWVGALRTYLVPFALLIGIAALVVRGRSVLRPFAVALGVVFALVGYLFMC
ncbi:MAG: hypothetical protein H6721_29055 [Sandaracinus sp.]|nr:hypothetical protein [Sandaracinus sp.]